jgi:hypothetical protein
MELKDILQIEGIVIRRIPKERTTYTRLWEEIRGHMQLLEQYRKNGALIEEKIHKNGKRYFMVTETKPLSLGGKYLIKLESGQDCLVRFDKSYCGIGDTIEQAYNNYLNLK